jgi:hypothetical protein
VPQFFVQPQGLRPDFRLVVTFLWGDFHNVDTDGNSYNPASREWTVLFCQNRECEGEVFEVGPFSERPLVLRVDSPLPALAARVAWFLAKETQSEVALEPTGPWHEVSWLKDQVGAFDLTEAARRASLSCWRRATLDNPYPNLRNAN